MQGKVQVEKISKGLKFREFDQEKSQRKRKLHKPERKNKRIDF